MHLPASLDGSELAAELRLLESPRGLDLSVTLAMWHGRKVDQWSRSPLIYQLLGDRLLGAGEPLMAYDVTDEGLRNWPSDVRLRQLQGLALARSGATARAQRVLRALYDEGHTDEETVGLLARTHKDLYFAARPAGASGSQVELRSAADLYAESFAQHGGYWAGINAATTALVLGERERAVALARTVREQCARLLESLPEGEDAYWLVATLGEASIILEEWSQAEQWYARAAEYGRQRLGDLVSTRHNARLLLAQSGGEHAQIESTLRIPAVAVFTGHMVDQANRAVPRFPGCHESAVREALRERLIQRDCSIGYASAAAGADILFLEVLLELGGEINVVLPYAAEQFLEDNGQLVGDPSWRERSERVLRQATRVIVASEQQTGAGTTRFELANLLLDGLAINRAEHLETDLVRMAVWDGKPGDGPGGTASVVEHWQDQGLAVEIVTPPAVVDDGAGDTRSAPPAQPNPEEPDNGFRGEIVAMLFGDAVHFSHLGEAELVRFGEHFLGAIGNLINTSRHAPVLKNTWGDGLFFVFSSMRDAGNFAMSLTELVNGTDWVSKGLPSSLNLRIGLHARTVFSFIDPITGRPNYLGTQVSRAARIEPITPPGQVYASEVFAALTAAERIADFTCDYVGQTPLAKGYGTFPTYHVRPT
jgi:class 3 adenylate cyclase/tetratricopeptide (TPR) repeat protein